MSIVYSMVAYKQKVFLVEDNTLYFFPNRQNRDSYPREYKNCGDYYSMVIPDYGQLCDTVILDNTDIISNNIL